jgi:hypothetical protein
VTDSSSVRIRPRRPFNSRTISPDAAHRRASGTPRRSTQRQDKFRTKGVLGDFAVDGTGGTFTDTDIIVSYMRRDVSVEVPCPWFPELDGHLRLYYIP